MTFVRKKENFLKLPAILQLGGGKARVDTCNKHKGFFRGKDIQALLKESEVVDNLDLMCNKEGEIRFTEKYDMKNIKVSDWPPK